MANEKEIRRVANDERMEQRSASKAAYDAAMALGAVTGGTGTLVGSLAAAKLAFGKKPKKSA
jgi:Na+/H+ antiporter NhaD/arsenite permease-like protein